MESALRLLGLTSGEAIKDLRKPIFTTQSRRQILFGR
jgi:hypothetical protein